MRLVVELLIAGVLCLPFAVGVIVHAETKVVSVGGAVLLNCDTKMFPNSQEDMKALKFNYKCFECSAFQDLGYVVKNYKGVDEVSIPDGGSRFNIFPNENKGIRVVILDIQEVDGGLFQCELTLHKADQDGAQTLEHLTLVNVQNPVAATIELRVGYETPVIAAMGFASILVTLLISLGIAKFVQTFINRMNAEEAEIINHLKRTRRFD
ncbi:unnamed protein product [Lymnaea stagnalis]|uniref:Uncharacterized protein n=1 Tax=Lymnaea stagnalis TaxID=6523 RepID=A0AAV2I5D5_LYMST